MASEYGRYPSNSEGWKPPVATAASLPVTGNQVGDARTTIDSDIIYVWDGIGWLPVASPAAVTAITALLNSSDVTALGPGAVAATVNSVGGKTAAQIAQAVQDVAAAVSTNTPSTIVKRDVGGSFSAQDITLTGNISASNFTGSVNGTFTGSSSGTNTGDVTLTAVGSTPNANAATLTGQALNLQPASTSFPGVVTTGTQSIAGTKTFTGDVISNSLDVAGTAGAGFVHFTPQSSIPTTPASGFVLYSGSTGRLVWKGTNGNPIVLDSLAVTGLRVYTMPDQNGTFLLDSQIKLAQSTVAGTVTIAATDAFSLYLVNTSAARTINLPSSTTAGTRQYSFKDITGTAGTNNISLVPNGTDQIEGLNTTKLLQTNYGFWTIVSDGAGKWWMI